MEMTAKFKKSTFSKHLRTMLHVDFRRMFTIPLLYIMVGACLVMPILILVMTTMMDGSVTANPQTSVETVIEVFDSTWQIIVSASTASNDASAMGMSMTAMCNINLLYFFAAVLVCLFVADDFRSGYVKNLFAVRAKKADYVISKTLMCFIGSAMMIAFFVGSMPGGAITGLSFKMTGFHAGNVVMCMLFFMMIPTLTPIDSTVVNVISCLLSGCCSASVWIRGQKILWLRQYPIHKWKGIHSLHWH